MGNNMKNEFLRTPEGNVTDFAIQYDKFSNNHISFKKFFEKFKEQKSINIKVNKSDLEFLNELSKSEGVSKNDLLEKCIEYSIEEFLHSLDMVTQHLIIDSFEIINDCRYSQNEQNFLNSWYISCYLGDLNNTINQFEHFVKDSQNITDASDTDKSTTYDYFRKRLREFPVLQEMIKQSKNEQKISDGIQAEKIKKTEEVQIKKQDPKDVSDGQTSFLQNRLDMLLLIDNHRNLIENQDFQIVTFRSNLKIVGMMEILSFILNIPMNQLFYESLHESIAQMAIYYDKDNSILQKIIYKITNKELKTFGFIDVLIKNQYIKYSFNQAYLEKLLQEVGEIRQDKLNKKMIEVKDE